MQFFTRAWLAGELTDEEYASSLSGYHQHLANISAHLSSQVREFIKVVDLHDGLIRKIVIDHTEKTLGLDLRCGNLQVGYYDVDIQYRGIQLGRPVVAILAGVAQAEGEILSDELDIVDDGGFEHRIIFDSYEEISILFGDLVFKKTMQDGRYFPAATKKVIVVGKFS